MNAIHERILPSSFFCWSDKFLSTAMIPFDAQLCLLMNSSRTSIAYPSITQPSLKNIIAIAFVVKGKGEGGPYSEGA